MCGRSRVVIIGEPRQYRLAMTAPDDDSLGSWPHSLSQYRRMKTPRGFTPPTACACAEIC